MSNAQAPMTNHWPSRAGVGAGHVVITRCRVRRSSSAAPGHTRAHKIELTPAATPGNLTPATGCYLAPPVGSIKVMPPEDDTRSVELKYADAAAFEAACQHADLRS